MTVDQIKPVILATLRAHLAPAVLTDAIVSEAFDADGDPILRIRAIVKSDGPDLAPDKVFSVIGKLRDALENEGESRFPLISFPSSNEIPGVAA